MSEERDSLRDELQRKIEMSLQALMQAKPVLERYGLHDDEAWGAYSAVIAALHRWQAKDTTP